MTGVSIELIREIEGLAADAWPAAVVEVVDGWRLRFNEGVTRRANSVWPNAAGGRLPLSEKLTQVEEFYARWNSLPRYQICPAAVPVDLDAVLAEGGYTCDARTCVQVAPVQTVLEKSSTGSAGPVTVRERLEERWYAVYCRAEHVSERDAGIRQGILERIGSRTGYALCEMEGQAIGIGLGVLERDWIGIFSMATRPDFRRRGAAMAVLHALARWGEQQGATRAYLQVMEENAAARALYGRVGFETVYHYHYRERSL
jgi:GNAT superfamily N-acetyltransferase